MLAAAYCDPGILPKQVEIATNLTRKYTSEASDNEVWHESFFTKFFINLFIKIPDKTITVKENAVLSKWCGKSQLQCLKIKHLFWG